MEESRQLKARYDIKKFLVTYKFLTPQAAAEFEAKIRAHMLSVDEKTRKLYIALLEAAKKGDETEAAFKRLQEVSDE